MAGFICLLSCGWLGGSCKEIMKMEFESLESSLDKLSEYFTNAVAFMKWKYCLNNIDLILSHPCNPCPKMEIRRGDTRSVP